MINRITKITIEYCPHEDGEVDFDQDCSECKYYKGMNKDYEVLCNYEKECDEVEVIGNIYDNPELLEAQPNDR